jgi:hypothetical protein
MSFLKKYWPTIMAAAGGVISFLLPSLTAYEQAHSKTMVGVLVAAVIAAYHAQAPKDQKENLLKLVLAALFLGLAISSAHAQQPVQNLYAAGVSYNNAGSPALAGTALYAHALSTGSGTYAFTIMDALPTNLKPFTVTSSFGVGVAQKAFSIGSVPIFAPTSAGISYNGSNTGWAWATGAMASIHIKGNWRAFPQVRVAKSSVSNGTGYQPIVGVMFGWGK